MVSGVLEVRIPAWMSARDEREAVADMLARVEKKQGSSRRSDEQLEKRARRLNAAFLAVSYTHLTLPTSDPV